MRVDGEWRDGRVGKVFGDYAFIALSDGDVYVAQSTYRHVRDFRSGLAVTCQLQSQRNGKWRARAVGRRDVTVAFPKLNDGMPQAVLDAIGDARVENGRLVGRPKDAGKLWAMLEKSGTTGWATGARGWRIELDKDELKRFVGFLERLQKTYKCHMRRLLKSHQAAKELFYQHGHEDAKGRTELWTLGAAGNLKSFVANVRSFLEVIRYYDLDARARLQLPWLPKEVRQRRSASIFRRASALMRGSDQGPDGPVQWAGHQPRNGHHLTVVTTTSMTELVVGLASILRDMLLDTIPNQFLNITSLGQVTALLDILGEDDADALAADLAHVIVIDA